MTQIIIIKINETIRSTTHFYITSMKFGWNLIILFQKLMLNWSYWYSLV